MKYFENKRVRNTINKIEGLKTQAVNRKIYGVRMSLERVSSTLINRSGKYTRKQYRLVNDCLDSVARNLSNEYSTLIKNECLKASSIILGTYSEPSKAEQLIITDQQKADELESKIRYTTERLAVVNKEMDATLGNDEITWKKLNKERTFLMGNLMAANQVFDSLLTHSNNLKNAEALRDLRNRYSALVIEQQPMVDMDEFVDNAETNKYANEESNRQSSEMSKILYENCADDDDAYRKALEQKMISSSGKGLAEKQSDDPSISSLSLNEANRI